MEKKTEKSMDNYAAENQRRDKLELKILDFIASLTARLEEQQTTIESLNTQLNTIYTLLTPATIEALNNFVSSGGAQAATDISKLKTLLNTSFAIPIAFSIN